MSKKRICLIGQFPPPIHGLSKAIDTLYKSKSLQDEFEFIKVDITNNKKFLSNYRLTAKTDADLFYFTVSQSIGGNIRDLLILRLLRKQNKKCLIHLHGGYFRKLYENDMKPFQQKRNKEALKQVAGAIVLGNSLRYIYEGLVKQERIFVVPNCVDDEFLLSEREIGEKIRKNEECLHVLYLSNFIRSKGYDIVLQMAKKYRDGAMTKKLHFDFAGKFFENEEQVFFESFVKENHLEDVVTYHGVVSGDQKRNLLKNSTFFILPTNYPREGQPISILEAMGNGMVILTTDHAGIPDVIQNGVNGCMLPYSHELPQKYLDYVNGLNAEDIHAVQERNYKSVISDYLENTYIDNLRHVFISCIK